MSVKDFYDQVKGNYQDALTRMMMDSFIMKMLSRFFQGDPSQDILAAYRQKEIKKVFTLAHTLKGVTGNLSLIKLHELSCVITEKTRHLEDDAIVSLDEDIKRLEEEYQFELSKFKEIQ